MRYLMGSRNTALIHRRIFMEKVIDGSMIVMILNNTSIIAYIFIRNKAQKLNLK